MNVISQRIFCKNGSEGPRHDPYGYQEIVFVTQFENEKPYFITLHDGLACWVELGKDRFECNDGHPDEVLEMVGLTASVLYKLVGEVESRCPRCGSRKSKATQYGRDCVRCGYGVDMYDFKCEV